MNTIIKTVLILLVACKTIPSCGQKSFHFQFEYNYLHGFYEKNLFWDKKSGMSGFDFNLTGMYDFSERVSVGAGVGIEKLYEFPTYTIFPVFSKITYSPLRQTVNPYIYTRIGYGIGTNISNPGLLFNPGIGYKLRIRKHFNLNFMLGYHLQAIRYDVVMYDDSAVISKTTDNSKRHSLSAGIGIVF